MVAPRQPRAEEATMADVRRIKKVWKAKPTVEGAGVRLKRAFGYHEVPQLDPFLLLDDFRSNDPAEYVRGFPWHPHRGLETITYVLAGDVEHGDSLGNRGVISSGDVQWMTAGSGIIHQEMPKGDREGRMWGFQLWANLPARHKMMDPRYREVKRDDIPEATTAEGATVRVVCGEVAGVCGNGTVVLYGPGDTVAVSTEERPVRFLLVSGRPLGEPVAWYGPIVMNTQAELRVAFREYEQGTFVKHARR